MTMKSRRRRENKRKKNNDVDPYTERYRKASDAAKAARKARIIEVSLFEERPGRIEKVVSTKAAPDAASIRQREVEGTPRQLSVEQTPEQVLSQLDNFKARQEDIWFQPAHRHFFEELVNTLPVFVREVECRCENGKDHWTTLDKDTI